MFDAEKVTGLIAEAVWAAKVNREFEHGDKVPTDAELAELSSEVERLNSEGLTLAFIDAQCEMINALWVALSSLRDAEPVEARLERLSPDFRADLVDAARIAITQVWADVPGGVDAATLASNAVMAQEFFWLSRQAPVRDAAEDAETDWEYGVQYASGYGIDECHSREHALAIIGAWGGVGTLLKRTPEAEAGPWLPVPEGADRG